MHRSLLIVSVAILALGAASASAATVIIGNTSQSSSQGVNSSQLGLNGSGGASTFILGNSTPTLIQNSTNVLSSCQSIGGRGCAAPAYLGPSAANFTLIGNASQVNQQAVNSQQVGVNAIRGSGVSFVGGNSAPTLIQNSFNILLSDIILG